MVQACAVTTRNNSIRKRIARVQHSVQEQAEAGLATAEYAIATVAAAGFAGLLLVILRSGEVRGMLTSIVQSALSVS